VTRPGTVADESREWLLARLRLADGPRHGVLVAELVNWIESWYPAAQKPWKVGQAKLAVHELAANGLAVTEPDETVWLTPRGWREGAA